VESTRSHVTFSPDGRSIAYVKDDPVFSLVIASNDGTGERVLLEAEPGVSFAANPAWSPDGKTIAFGRFGQNATPPGKCTLSGLDPDTGEVRSLSTEIFDTCHRVEWRRDGKGIVFVGTKLGDGSTIRRDQVYYMQIADGVLRRLTSDPSRKQEFSLGVTENGDILAVPFTRSSQIWVMDAKGSAKTASRLSNGTADGRAGLVPLRDGRIAFTTRVGENLGVWLMDGDGGNRRQIVSDPTNVEELRSAPDGKYFFFAAEKEGWVHLFRVDANGSNMKQITEGESIETDSTISPDGKWIAFDTSAAPGSEQKIWRTSIEGGARTKISDQLCSVPHYSPSGKFISCVWDAQIFVISSEDGRLLKSFRGTPFPILNIGSRWTPDEKGLVYIASVKGSANLWVQPLDGKSPRPLTDFVDGDIYNFAYSPDGSKLYLARGYQVRDAILIKNPR